MDAEERRTLFGGEGVMGYSEFVPSLEDVRWWFPRGVFDTPFSLSPLLSFPEFLLGDPDPPYPFGDIIMFLLLFFAGEGRCIFALNESLSDISNPG